jgi:MFS family permease
MPIHLIFLLSFIHEGSFSAARVIIVLFAVEQGAQPFAIGLLAATFSVFPVLCGVQAGRLADRHGARWPLLAGTIIGVCALLVAYGFPGLPAMFVAAAMIGLFDGMFVVSVQSLVGTLSSPDNRARNYSYYTMIAAAAALAGPLVAGFAIDYAGHRSTCLYLALVLLIPVLILAARNDALRGTPGRTSHAKGGAWAMLANSGVRRVLVTSSLMSAGNNLYQFYLPVYAHGIGLSASSIGMLLAVNAAATFITRMILPRLIAASSEERVLGIAVFAAAAGLMLIPLFENAAMLALVSFMFGFGTGCSGPLIMILMYSNSAEGRAGEGLGLKITVNHLTKMVSPVAFGALGSAFGLFPMFWVNGLLMSAVALAGRKKNTPDKK